MGFSASFELSNLNSGISVSSAGDVNGDVIDDLIIGADGADPNDGASGQSYVVFERLTPPRITLAVSPSTVTEDGTGNLTYTFTRRGSTTNPLTVNYRIRGTATNGTDYANIRTSVNFAANSATARVIVNPTPDTIVEPNETVALTLASGTGYSIGTPNAVTGTITNDDGITLAVSPASVLEDGTGNLTYTFTRRGSTTNPLTVNYRIRGTATNGTDYGNIGTSVNFAANSATARVIVNPTPDTIVEPNETVALTLASGTGYSIGTPNAVTGTITNDDDDTIIFPSITLAVSPSTVTENGTGNLTYTFTRTGLTTIPLIVNYRITGTATNGTDYANIGNSVNFAPNSATAQVIVNPTPDTIVEPDETVALTLASGIGYSIGTPNAVTGTITDDFPSVFELSTLNGSNGFALNGINGVDNSGRSVSSAGDVNGDGFDDIIIGAPLADPNDSFSGQSYVVFGKSSGFAPSLNLSTLNGSNGFALNGINSFIYSGSSVSSAGDVNGDGFDDIIIGAPSASPNDYWSGQSYVVFGKSSGFAPSLNLSTFNGSNGFALNGIKTNDHSGSSVSSAGDVNGDGIDDLIIGAWGADLDALTFSSGQSYVVFGKRSGFAPSLNLSTLNGSNGFALNGINANDYSGISVSSAGDVNGDGFADLIIGADNADPNGNYSGQSYVVFGKRSGFAPSLNLSTLNGSNGFAINGINADDHSGTSVSSAEDVNGDGFADLIIGARDADPNGGNSGQSYVVFGKRSGFAPSLNLSTLNGSNGFALNGINAGDSSGFSVSSAGDVNGDGFADLIIGADNTDPNGDRSGQSYVVFGKSSGFSASLNLSTLNGTNGFALNGINAGDYSGRSVSSAGDVNGDGFADLIIGAPGADPNGNDRSGQSYVVFGRSSGGATPSQNSLAVSPVSVTEDEAGNPTYTFTNDTLNGSIGSDINSGLAENDTLTGGGNRFVFNSPSAEIDTITNFVVEDDTIAISRTGFGAGLAVGTLPANQFIKGTGATTASHRFIYNNANGGLFFDADGTGSNQGIEIATLSTGLAMTNADFVVI